MNAIVIGLGSSGDVHPMVGLALALQSRGHKVLLVAPVIFEPLARLVGLEFAGIGREEQFQAALVDPEIWHPVKGFAAVSRHLFIPSIRPVYDIIAGRCGEAETVVAAPFTAFGARIAHDRLKVPLATIHLQPIVLPSLIQPPCYGFPDIIGHMPKILRKVSLYLGDRLFIDPVLGPAVNGLRAELELPPVRRILQRWAHSPQRIIGLFPPWYGPPQPDWPPNVELTGFPLYDESDSTDLPAGLTDFLRKGDPPVVFTAGTGMTQGEKFFRTGIEACRRSGKRGIVLTRFPQQLPGDLPEGIVTFPYIPFSKVLPHAAAIVHHGGIGTVGQALAAGIPQLVVPFSHDQPDNAMRIRRLGVGDFVVPKKLETTTIVRKLQAILASQAIRNNCRERAAAMTDHNVPARTCELVEGLL